MLGRFVRLDHLVVGGRLLAVGGRLLLDRILSRGLGCRLQSIIDTFQGGRNWGERDGERAKESTNADQSEAMAYLFENIDPSLRSADLPIPFQGLLSSVYTIDCS